MSNNPQGLWGSCGGRGRVNKVGDGQRGEQFLQGWCLWWEDGRGEQVRCETSLDGGGRGGHWAGPKAPQGLWIEARTAEPSPVPPTSLHCCYFFAGPLSCQEPPAPQRGALEGGSLGLSAHTQELHM